MAKVGTAESPDGGRAVEGVDGDAPVGDQRDGGVIDGIAVVDPGSLSGSTGDGTGSDAKSGKRRRGRPAGAGSKPTQKEVRTAVSGIEPLLLSLHKGVAGLLKAPEFELDAAEAKLLAENMANVASQYSVEVNPKYMAWIALVGCLIAIYGPRFGAVFVKKQVQSNRPKVVEEAPASPGLKPVPMEPFYPPQNFG